MHNLQCARVGKFYRQSEKLFSYSEEEFLQTYDSKKRRLLHKGWFNTELGLKFSEGW